MQTITAADARFSRSISSFSVSRLRLWAGRAAGTLAVGFLGMDAAGKLLQVQPVVEGTMRLGYPPETVLGLGVTLLLCIVAYVVPRTAVLGAVLLTGYLGGAVATHVRVGSPLLTHVLFPTYVAAFLWGSLALRDPRVVSLVLSRGRRDAWVS